MLTCESCGSTFAARKKCGPKAKRIYCSQSCRIKLHRLDNPRRRSTQTRCDQCGETLGKHRHIFCSTECRQEARRPARVDARDCVDCGESFMPLDARHGRCTPCSQDRRKGWGNNPRPESFTCAECQTVCRPGQDGVHLTARKFCSKRCGGLHTSKDRAERWYGGIRRANRKARVARLLVSPVECGVTRRWVSGHCHECGEAFVGRWHSLWSARFCSDPCQRKHTRRAGRAGRKTISDKQRAEKYGVEYEPVDRQRLFERDDYRCGICFGQTNETEAVPHPRAPTLDHVVPISKGGPHTWDNTQCACFECNWRKGDSTGAAANLMLEPKSANPLALPADTAPPWTRKMYISGSVGF